MVPRAGEHWTAVAGMDGAFGAEKIVDEDLLLETLLLPSTGLLGSGTIREKQLSLHKWVVSLAGLREELSTQVRKVHQTKAIMTEQKMREQTRLLEQLSLILKAAKSSFDGHLSSMRDLNADVSVLVQKMDVHFGSIVARMDRIASNQEQLPAQMAAQLAAMRDDQELDRQIAQELEAKI